MNWKIRILMNYKESLITKVRRGQATQTECVLLEAVENEIVRIEQNDEGAGGEKMIAGERNADLSRST